MMSSFITLLFRKIHDDLGGKVKESPLIGGTHKVLQKSNKLESFTYFLLDKLLSLYVPRLVFVDIDILYMLVMSLNSGEERCGGVILLTHE